MPLLHFQGRENKGSHKVENEWRRQANATVNRNLKGNKKTSRRAEGSENDVSFLSPFCRLRTGVDLPRQHLVCADCCWMDSHRHKPIRAQFESFLISRGQREY